MILSIHPLVAEVTILGELIVYLHEDLVITTNMTASPIEDFSFLIVGFLRHKLAKLRHGRHHVAIGQILFNLVNLHVHFLI